MAETLRVRVAWGGGGERRWTGTVSASQGTVSEPRALGIEADEPGTMWLEPDPQSGGNLLRIRQRSARAYDGVDLLVDAPLGAKLVVQLTPVDDVRQPARVEVPLAKILGEFFDQTLDAKGNRLLVRRTPGDTMRVSLARDSLVFSPGEVFQCTLQPHVLPLASGSKVQIKVQLAGPRGELQALAEHNVRARQPVAIPLEVLLPKEEGVYELVIAATHTANWQQAVRAPLNWKRMVAQRRVQLLVLRPDSAASTASNRTDGELKPVVEIDPANPRWWERLAKLPQLPKIPRLWKAPLGNDNMKIWQHPLGELVRLSPSSESPDVSWEAYTLPINQPGRPHVLELAYPSDVPQTLGISVLETNAAGALMPIGLDSGVDLSEELAGGDTRPQWRRHRLIFWPRTTSPMVLITNLRDRSPAVYGKIRVLGGWEHLPPASADKPPQQPRRLLLAYLDRPLFPENFSAGEQLDSWSGRSLDDWGTFYQGGTRLVEYLRYVGFDGLMVSVLADGSTIYPSPIVEPTPRYDTGVFFATGQDPVHKDVLEMLFRLFDREGLQLIPAIEFAAPLPELEAVRRKGGRESEGIEWIGPHGATWCQTHAPRRGLAPYYNVLHPRVQEAMLAVAREVIDRYSHHPSFAGLAIRLSTDGYGQLRGPQWGLDDATIARFERDVQLQVPGEGPDRFALRADFLARQQRRLWLEWRGAQLSRFYHRVHHELTARRPGSRLYLAAAGALSGVEAEEDLRPALPRRTTIAEALLRVGIDAGHYQQTDGLVLLRPERLIPAGGLNARAVNLEISQMPDVDHYFRGFSVPGSLLFHQPREVRVESFDGKSPFKVSYTWLVSQPVPSGSENRRRFVHSLATLDSQVILDGGWMLPLGQEESIRDLVSAYRRLPAVRFQAAGNSSQPVTFRYATHAGHTYVYVVNDAAFATTARIRVAAPPGCRLEELTGLRKVPPLKRDAVGTYWDVELQPNDLVAVRLTDPDVQLSRPQAALPGPVETALNRRIHQLGARAASLRNPPPPLKVLDNAGFEKMPAGGNRLPGWVTIQRAGVSIGPDKTHKLKGKQSARISSNGPVAALVSQPFRPPATGRLSMSVWLRVADAAAQPPLRLAVEGKVDGRDYYRCAPVGLAPAGAQAPAPIGVQWTPYVFLVDDLPLNGLSLLRVRFDLTGPGEVWVDDVQLFDLQFGDHEVKELFKLITLADVTLQNGQVGDCMRLLEGYWPQFLEQNVPLPPGTVPGAPSGVPAAPVVRGPDQPPAAKPPQRTGLMNRLKGLLPKPLRF